MLDIIAAQVHYYGVFNINERGENMNNPTDNVVRYQDCVLCGDQISSERHAKAGITFGYTSLIQPSSNP